MYTTILIAFLCYTDGGKSYIFKDIANYYFLLKVSLIFFFRPSLIFCIHVFLVSCVWISRMNFSPHMPSLYISESFWISSVCFFSSVTKCMSLLLWFWTSFRINWVSKKPCMEKSCVDWGAYQSLCQPIMLNLLFFCLLLSWHFFLWYFFHGIYLMYIIHTPCLKCWWYLCHVQVTWCLCKKFMQIKPRLTISAMVWLTKLSFQSSL